jgi:hypothetical protein
MLNHEASRRPHAPAESRRTPAAQAITHARVVIKFPAVTSTACALSISIMPTILALFTENRAHGHNAIRNQAAQLVKQADKGENVHRRRKSGSHNVDLSGSVEPDTAAH